MGLALSLRKNVDRFSLDVTWEIRNELAVLFGFSGAGKSMTLQMIAGLLTPDDGFVQIGNITMYDSAKKVSVPVQERHVGYLFQDLALFPHMTAVENILYGSGNLGRSDRAERAREMIGAFHLEGREKTYPSELSGGERQRVAFARALMRKPHALLLDEPFSALDNPLRLEMRSFLKDIKARFDVPVVFVTHDIPEALALADTLIIYSAGRVIQVGPVKDVIENPCNAEVEILLTADDVTGGGPCQNHFFRRKYPNIDMPTASITRSTAG